MLRRGCALHCAHHSIVSLIASPCCSYETRCLGPDLIGGPGALHSVASAYAAIAFVALTVVNAGRPSSTRQCHGSEAAAHRRRIAERCMGRAAPSTREQHGCKVVKAASGAIRCDMPMRRSRSAVGARAGFWRRGSAKYRHRKFRAVCSTRDSSVRSSADAECRIFPRSSVPRPRDRTG